MRLILLFLLLSSGSSASSTAGEVCSKLGVTPCVEVPRCGGTGSESAPIEIFQRSDGTLPSQKTTAQTTTLCHEDGKSLVIAFQLNQQRETVKSSYVTCNSAIYNLDVVEMFISPGLADPKCYSELDLSLANTPFFSGIINPNLNHTGISNVLIDCATSGIVHTTTPVEYSSSWTATFKVPLALLNSPHGCPDAPSPSPQQNSMFRANFFRINAKTDAIAESQKCSPDTCDYLAWSPNYVSPPAFHEPHYFGALVLV